VAFGAPFPWTPIRLRRLELLCAVAVGVTRCTSPPPVVVWEPPIFFLSPKNPVGAMGAPRSHASTILASKTARVSLLAYVTGGDMSRAPEPKSEAMSTWCRHPWTRPLCPWTGALRRVTTVATCQQRATCARRQGGVTAALWALALSPLANHFFKFCH